MAGVRRGSCQLYARLFDDDTEEREELSDRSE